MADLRVAVVLPNHAPHFGRDWGRAATAAGASVHTIEFVRELSVPEQRGIGSDGAAYQVVRVDPRRPARLTTGVAARLQARGVQAALDQITLDHGAPTVMHTHYYHQTRWVGHLRERPAWVHTEHSLALLRGTLGDRAGYPLSAAGLRTVRTSYGTADAVLAVSECLAESIRQLDVAADLEVLPNPVDPDVFTLSVERDRSLVVSVGRLSHDKQPDRILRAFAAAREDRPDLRLVWVGDGPQRAEVEAEVRRLGVGEHVSLVGRRSPREVAQLVGQAAVYVNSSRVETFGVAVAEALMTGAPVVAPRMAAVPELIHDGNGVLVAPDDDDALTAGLREALTRQFDHEAIGTDARQRWSAEVVGRRLLEIYSRVAAR